MYALNGLGLPPITMTPELRAKLLKRAGRRQRQRLSAGRRRRPWLMASRQTNMAGLGEIESVVGGVLAVGAVAAAAYFLFGKQLGLKKNPRTAKTPGRARKPRPISAWADYNPTPAQEAAYRAYYEAEKAALAVWDRLGYEEPKKDPTYRAYSKAADKAWARLVALHPSERYANRQYHSWTLRNRKR